MPFVASAVLVLVGLYVRLRIEETPAFRRALTNNERVKVPIVDVFRKHGATCCWEPSRQSPSSSCSIS